MGVIRTLNGLRGVAVMLVLIHHLPLIKGASFIKAASYTFSFGYFGVDVFFILSGFLITRILLAEKRAQNFSFGRFYYRRALRIFPAFYVTALCVGFFITWEHFVDVALYYSNYTLPLKGSTFHPMGHTWSLCVEEHFYLIWPLIIHLFTISTAKILIKYIFPLVAITTAVLTFIYLREVSHELIYRGTNYRFLTLSIGSYFAFNEDRFRKISGTTLIVLIVLSLSLFALKQFIYFTRLHQLIIYTPISCVIFLTALNLETINGFWRSLLISKPLLFLGKISYATYLFHYPIYWSMGLLTMSMISWQRPLMAIGVTLLLATVSYYAIEKPILRLKKNNLQ